MAIFYRYQLRLVFFISLFPFTAIGNANADSRDHKSDVTIQEINFKKDHLNTPFQLPDGSVLLLPMDGKKPVLAENDKIKIEAIEFSSGVKLKEK